MTKKCKKTKYKFSITLKKAAIVLAEVIISGLVVYITDRPELIFLAPFLEGLRNYLKNKNN